MISTGDWFLGDDFINLGGYTMKAQRASDQLNARIDGEATREQVMNIIYGEEEPYEERTKNMYVDDTPSTIAGREGKKTHPHYR